MAGISVIILTKNEEKNILDCLETVSWADQIIILDDNSEDRTLEIVKSQNLRNLEIIERALQGDFSKQRNYALSKARHEWILFVDADERITPELRREINDFLIEEKNEPRFNGMYLKRKDMLWGKLLKHGETGHISLLRLAKKNSGKWQGKVHERWMVEGETDIFENYILHLPHQKISDFLREINFYTTIRAKELFEQGQRSSVFQIIFYPKAKFFVNFILKLGFLDGIEGLVFAIIMSFHSFLARAKLWKYSESNQPKS
jgi:glycosyltransferase involved in cell wall biosynthesis